MTAPAPRPYTRKQALQNAAFLAQLERTGNARDAARVTGLNRAMMSQRRNADPDFAQRWEAALTLAAARLARPDQVQGPARVVRSKGRLQLRISRTRTIDRDAEQRFLAALSATANVRLSARAVGFTHSSFYARARTHPGFAREMRVAIAIGAERLEAALLESGLPESGTHDHWRHNDPPAIPPMTVAQAMQMLNRNVRRERALTNPDALPKRGENNAAWIERRVQAIGVCRMLGEEEARMVEYAQEEWRKGGRRAQWEPGGWDLLLEQALRMKGRAAGP
ncbi:hypothetical protein ASE73_12370 [Sphingomonas sp. Leaf24]|uniref:hypothetical protein n=1 Tax=unclassified Sphingomonas TaxID=196159 RepID=UPI0006FCF4A5|nr:MULTISPECIES: hypothetical protein [unclassified Sphingomonas]KQM13237.1 hypothetical protein ASE50_10420 [Sphingomonas sp. Leaf5]KQM85823.1 hypothetical protein ASE73_12370 [Sphingomonas sp. Leaf24]